MSNESDYSPGVRKLLQIALVVLGVISIVLYLIEVIVFGSISVSWLQNGLTQSAVLLLAGLSCPAVTLILTALVCRKYKGGFILFGLISVSLCLPQLIFLFLLLGTAVVP